MPEGKAREYSERMAKAYPESIKYGGIFTNGVPRLFAIPGEVCVVLRGDRIADHREVADSLNELVGTLRDQSWEGLADRLSAALAEDFAPSPAFRDYLARHPKVFAPEASSRIALPGAKKAATSLTFYRVALDRDLRGIEAHDAWLIQQQRVCELVNLVNAPIIVKELADPHRIRMDELNIAAITPNWGFSAQHFCPGPGSLPVPIRLTELQREVGDPTRKPRGKWAFRFAFNETDGQHEEIGRRAKAPAEVRDGEEVAVVILDTCPYRHERDRSRAAYGDNLLLQQVLSGSPQLQIDDPDVSLDASFLTRYDAFRANLRQHLGDPTSDMRLADHGLFIAGIIHDIAPHAQIHLGRVLNGYGISSLRGVVEALQKITTQFPLVFGGEPSQGTSHARRLIINLSLGASLPPGEELLRLWLAATDQELVNNEQARQALKGQSDVIAALTGVLPAEAVNYLLQLRSSVRTILDWLDEHEQVLVVGAAGNDNDFLDPYLTGFGRPEPRWPAHYDPATAAPRPGGNIIGVAATNSGHHGAEYSNRGDVTPLGNGIAVWGGESHHFAGSELGAITFPVGSTAWKPSQIDAIKGIFSAAAAPTPIGVAPNETGWAYWSGTSFATPIIAGLAANLWAHQPNAAPGEIISQIVNDLPVPIPGQAAPFLNGGTNGLSTPIIHAWQEWEQH